MSPLGRYGALQSGRRQPCRPPPHTRASVVARAYLAERICPRVPPLWPWHPRAYIAPRLRGRPKLPSLSACTDGCPSCVRLSTVSRACREGIKGMPARWAFFLPITCDCSMFVRSTQMNDYTSALTTAAPCYKMQPSSVKGPFCELSNSGSHCAHRSQVDPLLQRTIRIPLWRLWKMHPSTS